MISLYYKQIASFAVSLISVFTIWLHKYHQYTGAYTYMTWIFTSYIALDSFSKLQTDFLIHHILSLLFGYYQWMISPNYEIPFVANTMYYFLQCEISSIFMVFRYWITHPWLATLNDLCFIVTFFKYRVYDYYVYIIHPSSTFYEMLVFYADHSASAKYAFTISAYGLYAINLYWFTIFMKTLYKKVMRAYPWLNSLAIQHGVCSYIAWIQLPVTVYRYTQGNGLHRFALIELYGVICLCMSTYRYHRYTCEKIVNCENTYRWPFVNSYKWNTWMALFVEDQFAIHVRCLTTILTKYDNDRIFLFLSACVHIVSMYAMKCNVLKLQQDEKYEKTDFFALNRWIVFIPIFYDVVLQMRVISYENSIGLALASYMMILTATVRPFYQCTHIALHVWAIVQAYYLVSPRE